MMLNYTIGFICGILDNANRIDLRDRFRRRCFRHILYDHGLFSDGFDDFFAWSKNI